MTPDPGDHHVYPSQAPARATASFDPNAPARCWLWDNNYALTLGGSLAPYMDGAHRQEYECTVTRGSERCGIHSYDAVGKTYVDGDGEVWRYGATGAEDTFVADKEVNMTERPLQETVYRTREDALAARTPKDLQQTTDGVAHLAYYDKPTQLSFTWNGALGSTISVSHGGYAEAVRETFEWTYGTYEDHDKGDDSLVMIDSVRRWFERACQAYVVENYSFGVARQAFAAGLDYTGSDDGWDRDWTAYDAETPLGMAFRAGRSVREELTAGE